MAAPVKKFREAALWAIHGEEVSPEWLRGAAIMDYLFYRSVKPLNIETPGFSKINVYCGKEVEAYQGHVFDGCTSVQAPVDFRALDKIPAADAPYIHFDLMATGVRTVFAYFDLDWAPVQAVVDRLKQERFRFSESLGTRVERNATKTCGVRLRCVDGERFEHCIIVADLYQKSKVIHSLPICTTFPIPEMPKHDLIELAWVSESQFRARFDNLWDANTKKYGRHHVDASGYDDVSERRFVDADTKRAVSELLVDISGAISTSTL